MKGTDRDPVRDDESDRYAIYISWPIVNSGGEVNRKRLCETSLDGIGLALKTMIDEGEINQERDRVGILDRVTRLWLINPFRK